jgi:hypothetical protein
MRRIFWGNGGGLTDGTPDPNGQEHRAVCAAPSVTGYSSLRLRHRQTRADTTDSLLLAAIVIPLGFVVDLLHKRRTLRTELLPLKQQFESLRRKLAESERRP